MPSPYAKAAPPVCTTFAASASQILKGSHLPLTLVLAFRFKIGVGNIPVASIEVIWKFGTSVFLRRSCLANFDSKTKVFTPSQNKVCDFENLKSGLEKVLSAKEFALANIFLFISFLCESIWYVWFCEAWYFGRVKIFLSCNLFRTPVCLFLAFFCSF